MTNRELLNYLKNLPESELDNPVMLYLCYDVIDSHYTNYELTLLDDKFIIEGIEIDKDYDDE